MNWRIVKGTVQPIYTSEDDLKDQTQHIDSKNTLDCWNVNFKMNIPPCLQPNYWKHYNLSLKDVKQIMSKLDAVHIWQALFYYFPDQCIGATNSKTISTHVQSVHRFKFQQKSDAIKLFVRCVSQSPAFFNLLRPPNVKTKTTLETTIQEHIPYLPIVYVTNEDFQTLVHLISTSSLLTGDFVEQKTSLFRRLTYNGTFSYGFRQYVPIAYNFRKQYVELVRVIPVQQSTSSRTSEALNPLLISMPDQNLATMSTYCTVDGNRYMMMNEEMCFARRMR